MKSKVKKKSKQSKCKVPGIELKTRSQLGA